VVLASLNSTLKTQPPAPPPYRTRKKSALIQLLKNLQMHTPFFPQKSPQICQSRTMELELEPGFFNNLV
jgi:hypothetical protein